MPLFLMDPPIPNPIWVDVRLILKPDGSLNREIMHPSVAEMIEELLRRPAVRGCVQTDTVWVDSTSPPPRESLDDAIRSSDFILLARVTGRSNGFYGGVAGTLLRLEPRQIFKGLGGAASYYAFMPVGSFSLGSKRICKTDERYAELPGLGDEALTFTYPPTGEHRDLLLIQGPGDILTLHGGKVSYPRRYREAETEGKRAALPRGREELRERLQRPDLGSVKP
jgi:hypothetical protein